MADNTDEIDLKTLINTAAEAANTENLDGYASCFATNAQKRIRTKAAILFVQHDITMEVLDSEILAQSPTKGEVIVKYRAVFTTQQFDVVSVVGLKKEKGEWKITGEKIKTSQQQTMESSSCSTPIRVFGGGCANGQCGVRP
jgi:hypothetical protein